MRTLFSQRSLRLVEMAMLSVVTKRILQRQLATAINRQDGARASLLPEFCTVDDKVTAKACQVECNVLNALMQPLDRPKADGNEDPTAHLNFWGTASRAELYLGERYSQIYTYLAEICFFQKEYCFINKLSVIPHAL